MLPVLSRSCPCRRAADWLLGLSIEPFQKTPRIDARSEPVSSWERSASFIKEQCCFLSALSRLFLVIFDTRQEADLQAERNDISAFRSNQPAFETKSETTAAAARKKTNKIMVRFRRKNVKSYAFHVVVAGSGHEIGRIYINIYHEYNNEDKTAGINE